MVEIFHGYVKEADGKLFRYPWYPIKYTFLSHYDPTFVGLDPQSLTLDPQEWHPQLSHDKHPMDFAGH